MKIFMLFVMAVIQLFLVEIHLFVISCRKLQNVENFIQHPIATWFVITHYNHLFVESKIKVSF